MFINSTEVANKLQVSKTTVFTLVKKGKLKPIYSQKQFLLFEAVEVENYLLTLKEAE